MAKYLDKTKLLALDKARKEIFDIRESIFKEYAIDLLDTDSLSSLTIYNIVSEYDPDYNINFARNGEDALARGVEIEQKCSKVAKQKRSKQYPPSVFLFHAMGDLDSERYIFSNRDKATVDVVKIYDISDPVNVAKVKAHLHSERKLWQARCDINKKFMKRDVISISESMLLNDLLITERVTIKGCAVFKA